MGETAGTTKSNATVGRDGPSIQAWGAMEFVLIAVIFIGAHAPRSLVPGVANSLPTCASNQAQTAVHDAMRSAPMGQMGINIVAFKELATVSSSDERVECSAVR